MSQRNPEPAGTDHVVIVGPTGTISHTQAAPEGEEGTTHLVAVGSNMAKIIAAVLKHSKKSSNSMASEKSMGDGK